MWRVRIRSELANSDLSSKTISRSVSERVSVKMTRAICTQFTMAITSATIHRLGLNVAARTMASSNAGKAIIKSVKRINTAPTSPRK